jgi:tRNA dimethylallyltransferase
LEVYELTGTPLSQWQKEHGFRTKRHEYRLLGLERERDELDQRILARTDAMLAAGWLDEVKNLVERGYGAARAMGSVGYRQLRDALASRSDEQASVRDAIVRATRIFVRRQRTWLRNEPVRWTKPDAVEPLLDALTVERQTFLA